MNAFSVEVLSSSIGIDLMKDTSFVSSLLNTALAKRNQAQLEFALELAQRTVLAVSWSKVLGTLLLENWHNSHREIAFSLQQFADPDLTETIYLASQLYLIRRGKAGDSQDFLRQCLWNLYEIGSPDARDRMLWIAQNGDEETQEECEDLLATFGTDKHRQWLARPRCLRPEFAQK